MISDNDTGLTNGLGVLDTLLVKGGVALDRELHFTRLRHDCKTVLRVPCPEFEDQVDAALKNSSGTERLRIVITGGVVDKPLTMPTTPQVIISLTPVTIQTTAVRCKIISAYPRIAGMALENCKRTDYTRAFAARQDALSAGYDDAILTNTNGNIACATTSNIFIEENGVLMTPPLAEGVLAGITRSKLISSGAREEIISIERLLKADAVYLTNSITGQRPVHKVGESAYSIALPAAL